MHWRVEPGKSFELASIDPSSTDDAPGDKDETKHATKELQTKIAELQERLRAEGQRSLLVVLQAMDGGGKDSTIKAVFRGLDPLGVRVKAFRAPSEEELSHDFLWRVHPHTPAAGEIGIFNRSHYEDVVAVRVRKLAPRTVWEPRFDSIINFEEHLHRCDTTIVKLFLHISKDEQAERLQDRRDRPDKHWKWNPQDLEDRKLWDDFQSAYEDAIARTSTKDAPWYVIPADRKWYRNWAVLTILCEVLHTIDPQFPDAIVG